MSLYIIGVAISILLYTFYWQDVLMIIPVKNIAIFAIILVSMLSWLCVILFLIDVIKN